MKMSERISGMNATAKAAWFLCLAAGTIGASAAGDEELLRSPPDLSRREKTEHSESLFSFDYLKLVADDVRAVFVAPAEWRTREWLTFGGVAAGIAAVGAFDKDIREGVQDIRSDSLDDVFSVIEPIGSVYSFAVLGGFYVGGEIFKDPRAKATALDGLSASVISGFLIVEPMKYLVGRHRPKENEGNYEFAPLGEERSMPSGHATQAFAVATVIAEHYDSPWVKVVSYGIAGLVGFARMERDAHWASDVLVGAAIGTCVGHVVVQNNERHRNVALEPMIGPDLQGVKLTYSF